MIRTQDGWIKALSETNCFWMHDENCQRPHALLRSGKHSNGYVHSKIDGNLFDEAASDLLELFVQQGGNISRIQGVVGPQTGEPYTGAMKLAELICEQIRAHTDKLQTRGECFLSSPVKKAQDGVISFLFDSKDRELFKGKEILLCEDIFTTGRSTNLLATILTQAGAIVLPYILTLINRSTLNELAGKSIISLIHRPMDIWSPEECPLCDSGSKAIAPFFRDNWARLTAAYLNNS